MRRWLVIFMLLLLPIRGLVGDAMAYSMLPLGPSGSQAPTQTAMHSEAAYALPTSASGLSSHQGAAPSAAKAPCHMKLAAVDSTDPQQTQCTTCHACNLSAALPLLLPSGILQTAAVLPLQQAAQWISADQRLLAKTPVF
jgi:hypothetical protein